MNLTILYEQQDLLNVALYLKGRDAHAVTLTVIHESINGTASYDIAGDESLYPILVLDKEGLVILARYHAAIVASAVLEVDVSAIAQGYVLHPRSLYNALLEQREGSASPDAEPVILTRPVDAVIDGLLASLEAR